jgi:hypothetical protein
MRCLVVAKKLRNAKENKKLIYVHTHNTQEVMYMPNMTLSLSKDLHEFVKEHNEINWSEIARRAMMVQAKKIQLLDKLTAKSKLTEEDIDILDHKVKEGLLKRFR